MPDKKEKIHKLYTYTYYTNLWENDISYEKVRYTVGWCWLLSEFRDTCED